MTYRETGNRPSNRYRPDPTPELPQEWQAFQADFRLRDYLAVIFFPIILPAIFISAGCRKLYNDLRGGER